MSGKYPWGNQSPATRLKQLEGQLKRSEAARDKLVEDHKKKLATHDQGVKAIKSDIRQVNGVIDKAKAEARAEKLASMLESLLDGADDDALEKVMNDGTLSKRLKETTEEVVGQASDGATAAAGKPKKAEVKA